jgi:hypothetical protein
MALLKPRSMLEGVMADTVSRKYKQGPAPEGTFHAWAPYVSEWAKDWSANEPGFSEFAEKMVPFFEEFLQHLYLQGMARNTFRTYCGDVNVLGYQIFKGMMASDTINPNLTPLGKLTEVLVNYKCSTPWRGWEPSDAECATYERMFDRFRQFQTEKYPLDSTTSSDRPGAK